jgi:ketosteroid isomerase-like protein
MSESTKSSTGSNTPSNDAYDTLQRFWTIQDAGDYSMLSELFSDDAELVDPVYGTFTGGAAIAGFMTKMNVEMAKAGASFRLADLAGATDTDGNGTVWAQWTATTNKGDRTGVGVYRTRNGKITYYRDYMNG